MAKKMTVLYGTMDDIGSMVVPRISKGKDKVKTGFEKLMEMGQRQLWPH